MAKQPKQAGQTETEDGEPLVETPTTLDNRTGIQAVEGLMADDLSDWLGETPEDATSPGEEGETPEESQADVDAAVEASDEGEEAVEVEDGESEVEEPESSDEGASDEESQTFEVKVRGEPVEVTLDELKSGFSRTEDYTRSKMELAEERENLREQESEIAEIRAEYAQRLQTVEQALQGGLQQEPDWEQLKQEDPERYKEVRTAWTERQEQLQAIREERQRAIQEQQQHQVQTLQERLEQEREKLVAKVPEWSDPETRMQEGRELVEKAQQFYGIDAEDIVGDPSDPTRPGIVDHRAMLALRDAVRYQELQRKQSEAETKAKENRRKSKTLKPGDTNPKAKKKNKARKRLRRSGRQADAVAAILEGDLI